MMWMGCIAVFLAGRGRDRKAAAQSGNEFRLFVTAAWTDPRRFQGDMTMASPPRFVHQNSVEWIIELWLAKHGGDPAPDTVIPKAETARAAKQIIRKLAAHLDDENEKEIIAALRH